MKTHTRVLIIAFSSTVLAVTAGCLNMPTKPAKISPTHVSQAQYKNFTCKELLSERTALSDQEGNLIAAQNERIKNSKIQGVVFGFGQGDSVAAPELADVKGRLVAVHESISNRHCMIQRH